MNSLHLFAYNVGGLLLLSELDLENLPTWEQPYHAPDVVLSLGSAGPLKQSMEIRSGVSMDIFGRCRVEVPGAGAFLVEDGARFIVQLDYAENRELLCRTILGSGLAILCHQLGRLPLHGSCVEYNGNAILFLGRSGAGKSTLAAGVALNGGRVISDDVCLIERTDAEWTVYPMSSSVRLLPNACMHLLHADVPLANSEKRRVHLDTDINAQAACKGVPISAICCLHRAESGKCNVQAVPTHRRTAAVLTHVYRHRLGLALGRGMDLHETVGKLTAEISIFDIRRPFNFDQVSVVVEQILQTVLNFSAPQRGH